MIKNKVSTEYGGYLDSSPGANNSPSPLHNFPEQINANITGRSFHNLLNPAFLGKFLIILASTDFNLLLNHLEQLLTGDQVVQDDDIFVIVRQELLFLAINH